MKAHKPYRRAALAITVSLATVTGGLAASSAVAEAATMPTLALKVLLIGDGTSDSTTAAWESALTTEGVPYTEVDATGTAPDETVALPTLSSGNTGYYNGVVIADGPTSFASGQLTAVDSYESTFGVNQVDGYMYPDPALGATEVSGGALDGTTGTLTSAGLAAFPELAGPVPFATGTYGYGATGSGGAAFTPLITDSAGNALAGMYQHPVTDAQAGVAELSVYFNYNSSQLHWLLLAPGLINWLTQDTHLGSYQNYVEMDIDDTFTPDDAWDTATHEDDYSDADALIMSPQDVVDAAKWSQANDFRLDQLFNFGSTISYYDGKPDPLLAQFQATDPTTGKPYADDFGWISHTYDTPYLDVGCATQNYIEAELNENTNSIAAAPGATAGTGGLGITDSTDDSLGYGAEDPEVFVPGNHSGFADLVPGNPATVDPPDLDAPVVAPTGSTLAAGSYQYAVTDQFTAADSAGQSEAYVTAPITVPADGSVSLPWQAICHAANYLVYREVAGSDDWSLIGNYYAPSSATLPDNSSGDPNSTSDITGGGELELTYTDNGSGGCQGDDGYCVTATAEASGWAPPTTENAVESPWEQNPYFTAALEAVGITAVGADASKPYPSVPDDQFGIGAAYTATDYAAGQAFVDGTAQVAPRHPINVFYDASTEAQEVDEYNTLYLSSADGGGCNPTTTTCLTTPATFAGAVNSVVTQMLQYMLTDNPEPSYVHQTNLIGIPPVCTAAAWPTCTDAATSGTPPSTADTTGDGLLYSVLDPLLAEYHSYFSPLTPYEQLTLGQIGTTLADQTAWSTAVTGSGVTASEDNGLVTVTNNETSAVEVPLTVPNGTTSAGTAFGQPYGGQLTSWVDLAGGSSLTLNEDVAPAITSTNAAAANVGAPFSFTINTTGAPAPALSETGALPAGITFIDNGNGTATIAGTSTSGTGGNYPLTITATSSAGTTSQSFVLTNTEAPSITSAATATFTTTLPGTYTITTTGYPAPSLTATASTLPSGLSFTDSGNGTGTVSGAPATGTQGTYPLAVQATNSSGSTATLDLVITVDPATAPSLSVPYPPDFTVDQMGTVTVIAAGYPTPSITEAGALPAGLTFTDNGHGTALLAGTPTANGTTELDITAANGVTADATLTLKVVVGDAPAFTSAASVPGTVGSPLNFTITTSGYPSPSIGESGLPSDLSFTDNGNGTATIAGTPTPADIGDHIVKLNTVSEAGSATQDLSLAIGQLPAITSPASASFTVGTAATFSVRTAGSPTASLTETGALPQGVSFVDNGDGTATISGTPAASAGGSWPLSITATNTVGSTTQPFVLMADQAPAFTSTLSTTATVGSPLSFTVSTTGYPAPYIATTGSLPKGLSFIDNGDGTGTISGTPAGTETGSFSAGFTATNGSGTIGETLDLTIDAAPTPAGMPAPASSPSTSTVGTAPPTTVGTPATAAPPVTSRWQTPSFTSASHTTVSVGQRASFRVTTSGNPVPTLLHSALPKGLSWSNAGNGGATISGVPQAKAAGTVRVSLSASSAAGHTKQVLIIAVQRQPGLSSRPLPPATVGRHYRFTISAYGYPTPSVNEAGRLPEGLTFRTNGSGMATLSGLPSPSSGGAHRIRITVANSLGKVTMHYTLTVKKASI